MPAPHPDAVLFDPGETGSRLPVPACEHYAGDEHKLQKALALQEKLGGTFDVTADLEDGATSGTELQRAEALAEILAQPRKDAYRVGCRVHPVDHPAFADDIRTLFSVQPKTLSYLTLPKIASYTQLLEGIGTIENIERESRRPPTLALQVLIEDERALHDVFSISGHPRVAFIAFGQMDFTSSHRGAVPAEAMKSPGQFEHPLLRRAKLEISAAAHAHQKIPTHNPTTDYASPTQAHADGLRARNEFGFLRMWSIHPGQIEQILEAFAPQASDLEAASRILIAAQKAGWGPIADQGLLHDRASYRYYWGLLKTAKAQGRDIPAPAGEAFFRM